MMGDQVICNNKKIEQKAVVTIAYSLAALEQLKDVRIADHQHPKLSD
jgi:hypothetical protein